MKIKFIKQAGGILVLASDLESEKMTKLKTGELYECDIPLKRNPAFHRKVFAFFGFCFEHWKGPNEFQCESKQFDVFRSHLTVLAVYYVELYNIRGELRIEAQSISYSCMSQEEFERLYNALIQAALKHVFKDMSDNTYNMLLSFF